MRGKLKASITVEAALVLPIMIFTFVAFIYIIIIIGFEKQLYDAMCESADLVSKYSYAYDALAGDKEEKNLNSKAKQTLALANIYSDIYDKVDGKYVVGGIVGISLLGSEIDDESKEITLVADYVVKIPFVYKNFLIYIQQTKVKTRMFVGTEYASKENEDEAEQEEQYVYVTTNGTVYHTNENCTYIRMTISEIKYNDIENKRNKSGGKYYPCERCAKSGVLSEGVYITNYGNRYHTKLDCGEIKRSVKKVTLSSVEGMRECAKCSRK